MGDGMKDSDNACIKLLNSRMVYEVRADLQWHDSILIESVRDTHRDNPSMYDIFDFMKEDHSFLDIFKRSKVQSVHPSTFDQAYYIMNACTHSNSLIRGHHISVTSPP